MTGPTPQQVVDNILGGMSTQDNEIPLRNAVAANEPLATAIAYVLDKIRDGEVSIPLSRLYTDSLRGEFKGPRSYATVVTYIRMYLKRDHRTGKAL